MTMPTATPRKIRAVLDRSAIESYGRGHIHIGELLVDIADEGAHMAIPAVSLLEAHTRFAEDAHARALLRLLVSLPGIEVLKLDAVAASAVAPTGVQTDGDLSRAHAVWAANHFGALYLTTEPDSVVSLVPPGYIHPISEKDA